MKPVIAVWADTIFLTVSGTLDTDVMEEMLQQVETRILSQHSHYFGICDARHITGISPAARRRATQWPHLQRSGGNVVYGAGVMPRTLLTMVSRTMSLFQKLPVPLVFTATEAEAWEWITKRREALGLPPVARP